MKNKKYLIELQLDLKLSSVKAYKYFNFMINIDIYLK